MIRFCSILFFSFPILLCAQEPVQIDEQITDSIQNEYILDHKKQLNVKLEVSNDISSFDVVGDDEELNLQPNLNLRYAAVFSYKFLSVRLGIRPKVSNESKEEKGDSDTFRLRFQLLFDNWQHVIEYNYDRGFYASNTDDFIDNSSKNYIQFPHLTSNVFYLSSSYKFNKNYSMRAIESQTEIQAKSAGSLLPSASFIYYSLTGTDQIKDVDGNIINRDIYREYNGINFSVGLAYYYTFVLKKYWFINAFGIPSAGIDFYTSHVYNGDSTNSLNDNDAFLAFNYGFGGGYNGKKIFFGATYKNRITNEKFSSSKYRITPSNNSLSVYFGYRFKAPKQVSAPIDLIEDKVPILKDNH